MGDTPSGLRVVGSAKQLRDERVHEVLKEENDSDLESGGHFGPDDDDDDEGGITFTPHGSSFNASGNNASKIDDLNLYCSITLVLEQKSLNLGTSLYYYAYNI